MKNYDKHAFEPFAVTADICVFTIRDGVFSMLLVERGGDPFKGQWAIPGGFLQPDEAGEHAAFRELLEETGIDGAEGEKFHLEQLKTYSAADRDPRMRVVSTAYIIFAPNLPEPVAGDDAAKAKWFPVTEVLTMKLAFDHDEIVRDAVDRARAKLEYTTLATKFLPETFTKSDLYNVYVAVWDEKHAPDRRNFYRKISQINGFVEKVSENSGKSEKYRAGDAEVMYPPMLRS